MRLTFRDADRLKDVGLVERIADPAAFRWPPVDRLIGNLDGVIRDEHGAGGRRCGLIAPSRRGAPAERSRDVRADVDAMIGP